MNYTWSYIHSMHFSKRLLTEEAQTPLAGNFIYLYGMLWLPQWLSGKESAYNAEDAGDTGLIPGSGRPAERGHDNPPQYSHLSSHKDRGAWQATVHRVAKGGHN